jgi:hypothetical protein
MKKVIIILSIFLVALAAQGQKDSVNKDKGDTVFVAALQTVFNKYAAILAASKYLYNLTSEQVSQQLSALGLILDEAIKEWNTKKKKL